MNFDKLRDTNITNKANSKWFSVAIPRDLNEEIEQICRELNCKKTQYVKQSLLSTINEYRILTTKQKG